MEEAVIVDAVRTPFGSYNGSLRDTHPQDLAAAPLNALQSRNEFDPEVVDDVMYGCVKPVFEQGSTIGRIAPMVAGWGEGIPGIQLDRRCGSGQEAVNLAAATIRGGFHDVVIAGGVEHMTRIPMDSNRTGSTPEEDMTETYFEHFDEMVHQGESAERIAEKWDFGRRELDEIAAESHRRWKVAAEEGRYDSQIIPVETELDSENIVLQQDEHPRPDTTVEKLSGLDLAFRENGNGMIHAGNASGIVDGASALLLASKSTAKAHGWEPVARVVQSAVVGVDPVMMLEGPIPATEDVLEKAGLSISDIDLFEVNEAFASVIQAWLTETNAPWEKTNVNGGAIAHGHPLGATGAALLTKLVHELERTGTKRGLSTMCIGMGQGIATIVERVR
jgi:acetyl-CoA C-acetyltransferase